MEIAEKRTQQLIIKNSVQAGQMSVDEANQLIWQHVKEEHRRA